MKKLYTLKQVWEMLSISKPILIQERKLCQAEGADMKPTPGLSPKGKPCYFLTEGQIRIIKRRRRKAGLG